MNPTQKHIGLSKGYILASVTLFVILVGIALFVRDSFVRPFLGDVLAVAWVHLCFRAIWRGHYLFPAITALLIAFAIEVSQYVGLLQVLGLQDIKVARVILGATFDPLDLLAYTIGFIAVVGVEKALTARVETPQR